MVTRTETLTVATLAANADGVAVSAEVRREGDRYIVIADGQRVDSATNLRSAYEALAVAVRRRLPRGRPANWSVEWRCNTGGFGLVYGNRSGGGGAAACSTPACRRRSPATARTRYTTPSSMLRARSGGAAFRRSGARTWRHRPAAALVRWSACSRSSSPRSSVTTPPSAPRSAGRSRSCTCGL